MWKPVLVLGFLCAAAAAFYSYVRYLEKISVFFPQRESLYTPADIGLKFSKFSIPSAAGEKINAWYIPAQGARFVLLFCHGNAGNISTRLEKIRMLNGIGLSVFIFDYRGYGKSQGAPSESGVYQDADAVYQCLRNELKIPASGILIYGESLGGAVAVELARKAQAAGLVLESTFTSAAEMARRLYPFLPPFVFSVKFDSLSKISAIRIPKLFLHSRDDEIIPLAMAKKLYSRAPGPKEFVELSGPHNNAYSVSAADYLAALSSFVKSIGGGS